MLRVGRYVFGRLDVEGGRFTYGNRIAVGIIFNNREMSDYKKLLALYKEFFGYTARVLPRRRRFAVLDRLSEGLQEWMAKERQMLHYEPKDEEKKAGIDEYSRKVGDMATIKALAKEYGQDPDSVLRWEYSKVFGILYANLEEHKYHERYQKVLDEKYKRENKHYRK